MRVVILGGGRVGALIARRLISEGSEVVIVELSKNRCAELEAALDAKVIQGSVTSIETLEKAGLANADMLIAVTQHDEANILGCLIAQCNSNVKVKLLRLRTHEVDLWRQVCESKMLGVDLVIHPDRETAERIMKTISYPGISEIHDFADGRVKLFGMNVEDSWIAGKSIDHVEKSSSMIQTKIPMVFRGQMAFIPQKSDVLRAGDHVYIMTPAQELERVFETLEIPKQKKIERVFIVGGKQIGIELALRLERAGVQVKIFDPDLQRCELISGVVRKTTVVHADGAEQEVLSEEGVDGIDAYVAVASDDEDNIVSSLLARRLGARKSIALVNRPELLSMAQTLGLNSIFNSRLAVVDRILQYVRKGRVLSVTTFRNEEIEAIELQATANSKYVGRQVGLLRLPHGSIIGAIARASGEVVMPRDDAFIQEGDRVVFFCLEQLVSQLESAFTAEPQRGRS